MRAYFSNSFLVFAILLFPFIAFAQKDFALVKGIVVDMDGKVISGAIVEILSKNTKTPTNSKGEFNIKIPAQQAIALVFSNVGYKKTQQNFFAKPNENITVKVLLEYDYNTLQNVTVRDNRDRQQVGLIVIDAEKTLLNPSPIGGIESLIKIFVGSNNELTSQYNVRGGSYDENLVYINDFEIYRPYLVRSGQQEGLSFINPALTGNVKFFNGGFQAKYGDKLSSVLDVTYKKPKKQEGSAYIGLLEQGLHIAGTNKKNTVTYAFGARNRSNRNLLSSQETQGNYIPTSTDFQSYTTWEATKKLKFELLTNLSTTKFTLFPEESRLTSGVFSPLFSAALGLDINFSGQEKDAYSTQFIGLTATQQIRKNLQLKWLLSVLNNKESENIDITSSYVFGERDFDNSSATFGLITNPLGAGLYQNYSRNKLDIKIFNATNKGVYENGTHFIQWGNSAEFQKINDKLHEWEYNDSAGYSLPYTPGNLQFSKVLKSTAVLNVVRLHGFVQDNIKFKDSNNFIMQLGLRYNYNNLNNELLLSPRVGLSFSPRKWKKDVVLKAALGLYQQPPFYREMRRYDGTVNTNLKAQKSWQITAGADYSFALFQRPARLTTELYYKNLWDVVPYDIDNVRLRYFGENAAKAYAAGFETRLFGELVKDAESWVSLGFMRTKENLNNDTYTTYKNAAGEVINANTTDQVPTDSTVSTIGYLRRPTDRLITFGMFFQDYLSTNKNIKVYLNTLYGSNLPYNIPGNVRYRNALQIDPYIRIDIGFSAVLLNKEKMKRRYSPFKNFENITASLEVFNLIDRANTISYQLIKDFANNTYTMPNRLTPRMLNIKLIANW